jgi:hypothetical protein
VTAKQRHAWHYPVAAVVRAQCQGRYLSAAPAAQGLKAAAASELSSAGDAAESKPAAASIK